MLEKYGWSRNPFIFDIDPENVVGYEQQREMLIEYINQGHKVILVSGPTGAGKTTVLKWAEKRVRNPVFFSKPPSSVHEMVEFFNHRFRRPLFLFFLGPRFRTIYDVLEFLKKGARGMVVFVDEAHESDDEVLEWFRVFTDQAPGLTIVMAGLPRLEDMLRERVETFHQRISVRITLNSLSYDEMKQLILSRIRQAGGDDFGPFTEEILKKMYESTGGLPREVLRYCDSIINSYEMPERTAAGVPDMPGLTAMQFEIINVLMQGEMTPSEIVSRVDVSKYKSKHHALRSVNNILKQLLDMNLVSRTRYGRSYVYRLLPKVRNMLVER